MISIPFPQSPANNQTFTHGITLWEYENSHWRLINNPISKIKFTISNTPPANPSDRDRWYDLINDIEYTWVADPVKPRWVDIQYNVDSNSVMEALEAAGGAEKIGFKQTGAGASIRLLSEKLGELVSVKDFGAKGDGTTDDTVAIQAAIDACEGKRLFVPKGVYVISSTLRVRKDGIQIIGESNGAYTFGQSVYLGTSFKWAGGNDANSIMMRVAKDTAAAPFFSLSGIAIRNIHLDCGGSQFAQVGIWAPDVNNSIFEHIKIDKATVACLNLTAFVPDVTGINSAYNCRFNDIMMTTAGSGAGIYSGDTGNVGGGDHPAFCTFDNIHITYTNGTGIDLYEMDDCIFTTVGISREAGGTGNSIILRGSEVHGNQFYNINTTNADGTAPLIQAMTGSRANMFIMSGIDKQIKPTVDSGAECYFIYTGSNVAANTARASLPPMRFPNGDFNDRYFLDFYEHQATFTPTVQFGGASVGITTTGGNNGRYSRIGTRVFFTINVQLSSKGSSTGALTITGLPYTATNTQNTPVTIRPVAGFNTGVLDNYLGGQVNANSTSIALVRSTTGSGGTVSVTDVDVTNTFQLIIEGSYEVKTV